MNMLVAVDILLRRSSMSGHRLELIRKPAFSVILAWLLVLGACGVTRANDKEKSYAAVRTECGYIAQCSMSSANRTTRNVPPDAPGYGALNDWRIGNGRADSVEPATAAIGAVGLLYGFNRMRLAGRSSNIDGEVRVVLTAYFQHWILDPANHAGAAMPSLAKYYADGSVQSISAGSVPATALTLIAMRKYCEISPNGDRTKYQRTAFTLACGMGNYVDANVGSWTSDRSYAVAALNCLAHWALAIGDKATADHYAIQARTISALLAKAQDNGAWHTYFDYIDAEGRGVFDRHNVDQTGFAPYEFNARNASEPFAVDVAHWWDTGLAFRGEPLTVPSGPYAGGVCQSIPDDYGRAYPGDSFQLADAEWKIARAHHDQKLAAKALWHYRFALSPIGASTGSGSWVDNKSVDKFAGGFIDWVDNAGRRPTIWQRFVDTSGYMLIATEEVVFDNEVDWGA